MAVLRKEMSIFCILCNFLSRLSSHPIVTVISQIIPRCSVQLIAMKHQRLEKFPVSKTDELSITGESRDNHNRDLGDFKATNAPLSAADISKRKRESQEDWSPRTTENIEDIKPVPERDVEDVGAEDAEETADDCNQSRQKP